MVPLRVDSCEVRSWEQARSRPRLELQDVSRNRPATRTGSAARRQALRRRDTLWFAAAAAVFVLFFLVSFLSFAWQSVQAAYRTSLAPAACVLPHTVVPGDTLWKLAARFGDPQSYILERIETIARSNHLSSDAPLVPGQRLLIPVQNPVEVARLARRVAESGT